MPGQELSRREAAREDREARIAGLESRVQALEGGQARLKRKVDELLKPYSLVVEGCAGFDA
eukprot:4375343-Alexandrium_andersonii.AAC.1